MKEQTNKAKRPWSRARSLGPVRGKRTGKKKAIYDKLVDIEDLLEMIARQLAREVRPSKQNGGSAVK